MGSATFWALARRGVRVVLVEQWEPGHQLGSSHGGSRIFRTATFEGPAYVALAGRSRELWQQLERETGEPCLRLTGGLDIGAPDGRVVSGARAMAEKFDLPHELLDDPAELAKRFPQHRFAPSDVALWDQRAGVLFPEAAVRAAVRAGVAAGGQGWSSHRVERIHLEADRVVAEAGDLRFVAPRGVVAAGGWTARLLPWLDLPLEVHRAVMTWYEGPDMTPFGPERFPVFVRDTEGLGGWGVPAVGGFGVKLGHDEDGLVQVLPDPYDNPPEVTWEETEPTRRLCAEGFPGLVPNPTKYQACMTTHSPDGDFVIGPVSTDPYLAVLTGFSGHGAKHAAAVGEAAAELLLGIGPRMDLAALAPERLWSARPAGAQPAGGRPARERLTGGDQPGVIGWGAPGWGGDRPGGDRPEGSSPTTPAGT